MADPLSIIGAIAAIFQISSTVVNLIKTSKDASSDRQRLLVEINATTVLCQIMEDCAEMNAEPWVKTFQGFCRSGNGVGPMEQFQASLEYLEKKLAPGRKSIPGNEHDESRLTPTQRVPTKPWVQSLKWPFSKDEVLKLLATIERQKSLFSIALANDNLRLSTAMHDEVKKVTKEMETLRMNQEAEKRNVLLSRLSTIDFEAIHGGVSSCRTIGTGQWLLHTEEFESWLGSSSNATLWCRGIPGAGKTVLASLVLDHLRAR